VPYRTRDDELADLEARYADLEHTLRAMRARLDELHERRGQAVPQQPVARAAEHADDPSRARSPRGATPTDIDAPRGAARTDFD